MWFITTEFGMPFFQFSSPCVIAPSPKTSPNSSRASGGIKSSLVFPILLREAPLLYTILLEPISPPSHSSLGRTNSSQGLQNGACTPASLAFKFTLTDPHLGHFIFRLHFIGRSFWVRCKISFSYVQGYFFIPI